MKLPQLKKCNEDMTNLFFEFSVHKINCLSTVLSSDNWLLYITHTVQLYCFENVKLEKSFEVRTSSGFSIVQVFLSSRTVCQCFSHLSQQVKIVSTMQTQYSVSLPKLKKDTIHVLHPCQRLTMLFTCNCNRMTIAGS